MGKGHCPNICSKSYEASAAKALPGAQCSPRLSGSHLCLAFLSWQVWQRQVPLVCMMLATVHIGAVSALLTLMSTRLASHCPAV